MNDIEESEKESSAENQEPRLSIQNHEDEFNVENPETGTGLLDNSNCTTASGEQITEGTIEIHDEEDTNDCDEITGSLLGIKGKTIEEMYNLYCNHARNVGFSVRKSTSTFTKGDEPIEIAKNFVCSCSGLRKERIDDLSITKRNKGITRSNCQAMVRVKMNSDNMFEIVKHNLEHNHPLTRPEWGHFHRSERSITDGKAAAIEGMLASGMKAAVSFRYLAHDAGGVEKIGHTMKDHLNFVYRVKMSNIEGGDANTVIDRLHEQEKNEQNFYYKVRMDDESRLSNIFWRDSMMKEDFDVYGDVMMFDTTYRTNKYNLICAPFVGLNNHGRNVMFACAFIADEKIESFQWVFEVFKKSMGGKSPVTIFTDQDSAISNAIKKVFPETRHRLCIWHLQQNAVSNIGAKKFKGNLKYLFNKCLYGCVDETHFLNCWEEMVTKHKFQEHEWFTRLYELREKWCTALNKDFFSAGVLSSQRSESTNNAISFRANKTTTLTEFYELYWITINNWRNNEQRDEFQTSWVKPDTKLPMTGLVKHASNVYTLEMFKEFEEEFYKSMAGETTLVAAEGTIMIYEVRQNNYSFQVVYDCLLKGIKCICKKFEECGILCCHCLRILHINSEQCIPPTYILHRWTKGAKSNIWEKISVLNTRMDKSKNQILWRQVMAKKYYNLIMNCEGSDEAREILENGYRRDSDAVKRLKMENDEQNYESVESSTNVYDPKRSVTKGRSKRIAGALNGKAKGKGKKKNRKADPETREFGSKTPNQHLI